MWELDHKEGWALKNWFFWIVLLEKTLQSPWTARRSNQSILKEIYCEYSLEGLMLMLKLQYKPSDENCQSTGEDPDAGKDWRQEKKGMTEDEMVGWHHRLNGPESEWIPGDGGRQGSFVRCSPRGHKESDMAHGLNNNKTSVRLEVSVLCWALTVFNEKRSRDRWVSS